MSVVRNRASEWSIDPQRIGICGFSAGGEAAGLTALFGDEKKYETIDATDRASCRPNFSLLIYAAGFYDVKAKKLHDHVQVTKQTPATFLVHTFDDGVPVQNALQLYGALKEANVPSELHVFDRGGHGYGLRPTGDPVTRWPALCEQWMRASGFLAPPAAK
jgi:acetyl esterase/lipase